mgnify:CR=1 FL=1
MCSCTLQTNYVNLSVGLKMLISVWQIVSFKQVKFIHAQCAPFVPQSTNYFTARAGLSVCHDLSMCGNEIIVWSNYMIDHLLAVQLSDGLQVCWENLKEVTILYFIVEETEKKVPISKNYHIHYLPWCCLWRLLPWFLSTLLFLIKK